MEKVAKTFPPKDQEKIESRWNYLTSDLKKLLFHISFLIEKHVPEIKGNQTVVHLIE